MVLGKIRLVVAASFLLGTSVNAVECECEAQWSSPTSGCANVSGCPTASCDGVSKPWCKVSNPGCDQESRAEGWAWCGAGNVGIDLGPEFEGNPNKECKDVETDADGLRCFRAITWAKDVGITEKPEYYAGYGLTNASSRLDFQCALSDMVGKGSKGKSVEGGGPGSKGHHCPVPCSSTMKLCAGASPQADKDITSITTTTTESSGSSSFPWWAWLLLAVLLLAGIGGAIYFFMKGNKSAPKKKKRATKTVAKTSAPAPEPAKAPEAPAPAVLTAPPVYITAPQQAVPVYSQPTTYTTAAPMAAYTSVAPAATYTSVPLPAYASPIQTMSTAMPVQAMAVPIQQATSVIQQPSSVVGPTLG